jgi:peptidoglycan/LPS O-acetylase OafA/YrhL
MCGLTKGAPALSVADITLPAAPAGANNQTSRKLELDGLRAFAFLAVFLHHAFGLPMMWAGVDLFFVLSGYLITGILLKDRDRPDYFRRFYARRFLRIFPPYYLVLLVVFALTYPGWRSDWYVYAAYVSNVRSALSPQVGSPDLAPMWSLAIEEQFYLLFPPLVFVLSTRRLTSALWLVVALAFACRLSFTLAFDSHWPVYYLLPARADLLAGGALLAVTERERPAWFRRWAPRGVWLSAASLLLFVALSALPSFRTGANSLLFNSVGYGLVGLGMTGLVASFASMRGHRLLAPFRSAPLVFLGTISYMMYLCHLTVLNHTPGTGAARAAVAFTLVVGFSALSWFAFEKPLQALKDRLTD